MSVSILDRGKLGWAGIKRGVNCAGALHHDSGLLSLHGVAASIGAMRPTPAELEVARALIARVNEVRMKALGSAQGGGVRLSGAIIK